LITEGKMKKKEEKLRKKKIFLDLIFSEENPGRKWLHVHAGRKITNTGWS